MAEVLDELLPDREVNDAIFRLAVVGAAPAARRRDLDAALRISICGWRGWSDFCRSYRECAGLRPRAERHRAFFHALADGLMCAEDKRLASSRNFA